MGVGGAGCRASIKVAWGLVVAAPIVMVIARVSQGHCDLGWMGRWLGLERASAWLGQRGRALVGFWLRWEGGLLQAGPARPEIGTRAGPDLV